jgi:hypothetical protein
LRLFYYKTQIMTDKNQEGNDFQDKWMRGDEDQVESTDINAASNKPQPLPQAHPQSDHLNSREVPCDDDARYRHQQGGGRNPGDSKPHSH